MKSFTGTFPFNEAYPMLVWTILLAEFKKVTGVGASLKPQQKIFQSHQFKTFWLARTRIPRLPEDI